ncbi:MAG: AsnC family transcriptional regulator [Candidatus Thorarchaeota archaeon]|nr:MAG: AsnC family transcriptional regulator [Candidatus Thorarchaeota archaeon]
MAERISEKSSMTPSATELDETDIRILQLLQENCKMSIMEISKEVDKGISTVHARIKALESSGIIKKYTAILDSGKLSRQTLAFVLIRIRYYAPGQEGMLSQRDFCKDIAQHPLVQDVHVLSGEYDVLLKIRARDIDEINHFIVDFLRHKPAVDRTLTMFAMDSYLESTELRSLGWKEH